MSETRPLSEDSPIVFDMSLEEDIEAELEEFIFLVRLGLVEDAKELHKAVLKDHQHLFPVFAELAGFFVEYGEIHELSSLLKHYESMGAIFDSPDKHELVFFLSMLAKTSIDPSDQGINYLGFWTSYLDTHFKSENTVKGGHCPLSSAQIQTGEILLYAASKTSLNPQYIRIRGQDQRQKLLEYGFAWEALQALSILTDNHPLADITDGYLLSSDVYALYNLLQTHLPDDVHDDRRDRMLCDLKAKILCLDAASRDRPHRGTISESDTSHLTQRLPSQIESLLERLFKFQANREPRGIYKKYFRKEFGGPTGLKPDFPPQAPNIVSSRSSQAPVAPDSGYGSIASYSVGYSVFEDEENNYPSSDSDSQPSSSDGKRKQPFACPFNKFNCEEFGLDSADLAYHGCSTWHRFKRSSLLQHLKQSHYQPEYICDRCGEDFLDKRDLRKHRRIDPPCKLKDFEGKKLPPEIQLELRYFSRTFSREEYWSKVFDTIFGQSIRVERGIQPYYEGPTFEMTRSFVDYANRAFEEKARTDDVIKENRKLIQGYLTEIGESFLEESAGSTRKR